jgi:O-antigen/teichoic acid export membrane protein
VDNVAIGVFTIARIHLTPLDRTAHGGRLSPRQHRKYTGGFGYFFFTAIHGLFLVIIFPPRLEDPALAFGILALFLNRGFDFVFDYLLPKAYLSADVQDEAFIRVIVLHVAILGGGFLITAMKSNAVAALAALVVLKTAGDVFALYYFRRRGRALR